MADESTPTDPMAVVDPHVAAAPAAAPPVVGAPLAATPPPVAPTAPGFTAQPSPGRTSAPVGWVIAAMILFWPTGIPALLASHRAARAFGAGDVPAALHESANSRRWSIISVIVGAVLIVGSFLATLAWAFFVAVAVHDHVDNQWNRGPGFSHQQPFGGTQRHGLQGGSLPGGSSGGSKG